ncbi:hypothetical protein D3C72_1684030 [compost metagenome]
MKLLATANTLFEKGDLLTLADVQTLEALCAQASGKEAEYLGDLWSAALLNSDEQAFAYMTRVEDEA